MPPHHFSWSPHRSAAAARVQNKIGTEGCGVTPRCGAREGWRIHRASCQYSNTVSHEPPRVPQVRAGRGQRAEGRATPTCMLPLSHQREISDPGDRRERRRVHGNIPEIVRRGARIQERDRCRTACLAELCVAGVARYRVCPRLAQQGWMDVERTGRAAVGPVRKTVLFGAGQPRRLENRLAVLGDLEVGEPGISTCTTAHTQGAR